MEAVPGLQLVREDWNRQLGTSWGPAARLIRTTGQLATGYPCTSDPECGCVHGIVEHGDGDFVSVCCCEPRECDPRPLERDDVVVREMNVRQLAEDLALALRIDPSFAEIDATPATWSVGTYSPTAGYRFPIFLTVQTEDDDVESVVASLVLRSGGPFFLVIPTRDLLTARCADLLKRANGQLVALCEEFTLDAKGVVRASRSADAILEPLVARVVPPRKVDRRMVFFPTPPDATWAAVRIAFVDQQTVKVYVGGESATLSYADMGMGDGRSTKPTVAWELLLTFALRHGRLDWSSREATPKNQRRKETLSENLRAFFRITDEPFRAVESERGSGKGWEARFRIDPP